MNSAATNRPAKFEWHPRVYRVLIFGILLAPLLTTFGCQTSPQCRRATALLRAEIVDIEDKYAALQSQYQSNAARLYDLTGEQVGEPVYGESSNYGEVVISEQYLNQDGVVLETYPNEIIIEDEFSNGSPIVIDEPTLLPSTQQSLSRPTLVPEGSGTRAAPTRPAGQLPLPTDVNPGSDSSNDFNLNVPSLDRFGRRTPGTLASSRIDRSQATEIVVNRSATRGQDVDGVFGDEGLSLMIQPKNAQGQVVLQPGDLSVRVVDPRNRSQIGFWRFLPAEVDLFFVNDEVASEGILLHLPWDQTSPDHSRLLVHVEFITPDGRILKTSSDVRIKPPADDYSPEDPLVQQWTQRDPLWGNDADESVATKIDSPSTGDRWQRSNNSRYLRAEQAGTRSDEQSLRSKRQNPDTPKWRPVR